MFEQFWYTAGNAGPGPTPPDPGEPIGQSLRFRAQSYSSGSYLHKTGWADSGNVWTFSCWVKGWLPWSYTTAQQSAVIFSWHTNAGNQTVDQLQIFGNYPANGRNEVQHYMQGGPGGSEVSNQEFNDPSAWYHIVWRSASTSDITIWVNGVQVTDWRTSTAFTSQNFINKNCTCSIGARAPGNTSPSNIQYNNQGYMADVYFIDGQALEPEAFGRPNTAGVWVPRDIDFNGVYGANGFHLDFADPDDIGADRSGNSNDFTANGFNTQLPGMFSPFVTGDFDPTGIATTTPDLAFDGSTTTRFFGLAGGTCQFEPEPAIPFTGFRVFGVGNANSFYTFNGTTRTGNGGWVDFSDVSGQFDATTPLIFGSTSGSHRPELNAVEINGTVILTDSTGTDYDVMQDSPTQNWATGNPLDALPGNTPNFNFSKANLSGVGASAGLYHGLTTIEIDANDTNTYYVEFSSPQASGGFPGVLVLDPTQTLWTNSFQWTANNNSVSYSGVAQTAWTGATYSANDVAGLTYNGSTGVITGFVNGVQAGTFTADTGINRVIGWMAPPQNITVMDFNYGQRPFIHKPDGTVALQTQNMPAAPIANGRDHFQALTGAGPTTTITAVTQTGTGNYTLTNWMGNTGSGTPANDGYTANVSEKEAEAPNYDVLNQSAAAINNSMVNFNGIGTGNAGSRGTVHSSRFVFDPPLKAPIEFQTSIFTGDNRSSMLINGIAQDTSAISSNTEPFQVSNDDISNIVIFNESATYNTWFTIKSVNGVETGGFVDNTYEITVADASGFTVGDRIINDAGETGYITAINGNVLTVTAQNDNGWVVGSGILSEMPILEYAQAAFPNGLWWIKDRVNSNQHQLVDSVNGTSAVITSPAGSVTAYAAPAGDSVAWCWNAANTDGGFSISDGTHGLGTTPAMVIDRALNVWHQSLLAGQGLVLKTNAAATSQSWTVDGTTVSGPGGGSYYSWSEIPGYSAFGSYQGNSDPNGPFIYTGFRPAFILIKSTAADSWHIFDTTINPVNNGALGYLQPNTTNEEQNQFNNIDILSNGFKCRSGNSATNTGTLVYAAFAENPFGSSNTSPATAR